ncbi:MAG: Clp protease N-terminal domain-containing protein, partial [Nitrospinaceae bacterium]
MTATETDFIYLQTKFIILEFAMRFDRMTLKLQEAFQQAQSLCEKERQQSMEPEHLLLSVIGDAEGIAQALLRKVGVEPAKILNALETQRQKYPRVETPDFQVYLSRDLKGLMDQAFKEAQRM